MNGIEELGKELDKCIDLYKDIIKQYKKMEVMQSGNYDIHKCKHTDKYWSKQCFYPYCGLFHRKEEIIASSNRSNFDKALWRLSGLVECEREGCECYEKKLTLLERIKNKIK